MIAVQSRVREARGDRPTERKRPVNTGSSVKHAAAMNVAGPHSATVCAALRTIVGATPRSKALSASGPTKLATTIFASGGRSVNSDAFVKFTPSSCVKYDGSQARST